jgi:broad specificity phosphatase PhoE
MTARTGAGGNSFGRGELRRAGGIHLARHGQTAYNDQGRFQGHLPVPLDATGREQAAALAEAVSKVEVVTLWCSPLARARETADIVAARIGLEPHEDARFAETDTGDWTDRSFADVKAEDPEGFARFARSDPSFRYPGGESFAEQSARVMEALRDLRGRDGALPALVVCHRGVIRLALAALLGDDGEGAREIANASLVTLPELAADG